MFFTVLHKERSVLRLLLEDVGRNQQRGFGRLRASCVGDAPPRFNGQRRRLLTDPRSPLCCLARTVPFLRRPRDASHTSRAARTHVKRRFKTLGQNGRPDEVPPLSAAQRLAACSAGSKDRFTNETVFRKTTTDRGVSKHKAFQPRDQAEGSAPEAHSLALSRKKYFWLT